MSLKIKLILAGIVILIVLIPLTAYVISYRTQTVKTKAKSNIPNSIPKELLSDTPLSDLQKKSSSTPSASPSPSSSAEVLFGPTLSFKLNIEGRPASNQAAKAFIGISSGQPVNNPTYLLSFSVDVPASGAYSGLSVAGLSAGDTYTTYIRTPGQLTNQQTVILKSSITDLGTIYLTSGDLNEDNVINSADYAIAKAAYRLNSSSPNWNPIIDFNLDGIINNFDLGIIIKHFGTTGQSGPYYSPNQASPSPQATSSGSLLQNQYHGSPNDDGYWIWVPKI